MMGKRNADGSSSQKLCLTVIGENGAIVQAIGSTGAALEQEKACKPVDKTISG